MSLAEWRQAITTPTYRIGNSTFRFQTKFVFILIFLTLVSLVYISLPQRGGESSASVLTNSIGGKKGSLLWSKNKEITIDKNYPKSQPVQTEKGLKFRIGIISDLDQDSKVGSSNKWISYLRKANLFLQFNNLEPKLSKISVEWEGGEPHTIKSGLNQDGRGMELSELVAFDGKLLTCDDRTGIIYNLIASQSSDEIFPVPWVILADGNGSIPKGFKCEWGCVKDGNLWVGGLGKEWTTSSGELVNFDPQFVKVISSNGEVQHLSWRSNYNKLAHALNIHFPGYVIHESGGWSQLLRKWLFLPRRASTEQYNEKTDEKKGTNVMLMANEDFSEIDVHHVGDVIPTHGFSSFKWIPGTNDQLVIALKSEEVDGKTSSFITAFDIEGNVILAETKVGDHKYEGIEFL